MANSIASLKLLAVRIGDLSSVHMTEVCQILLPVSFYQHSLRFNAEFAVIVVLPLIAAQILINFCGK